MCVYGTFFTRAATRPEMHASIEHLVCRHRYERQVAVVNLDDVVERCSKFGKERLRGGAGA